MIAERSAPRPAAVALVALLAMALLPGALAAHLYLVRSEPADGDRLDAVPRELQLTFSEPVQLPFTAVELAGPDGRPVPLARLETAPDEPQVLLVRIDGQLRAGAHVISWRTASADGHVVRGRIDFAVADDADGLAGVADTAAAPGPTHHDPAVFPEGDEFGAGSPGYVVVRWLLFVGTLGVIGVVGFRVVVLGLVARRQTPVGAALIEPAAARSADVGLGFALLLGIAVLARLYAQSLALHGPGEALSPDALAPVVAGGTNWGWGWLLQLVAVVLLLLGFSVARRTTTRPRTSMSSTANTSGGGAAQSAWVVATAGAVLLAFASPLGGHAAAVPAYAPLAVLSHGLHVLGASGWLGSLLAVILVGIPAAMRLGGERRARAVAVLVNAYSPTALGFAALVVVTGVLSATFHMDAFSDLWRSDYGRTLLLKLGILALVVGTGAYNWLRVRPRLGDDAGVRTIRRSAGAELAIAAAVLLVTAVLVATPPPVGRAAGVDASVAEGAR